MDGQQNLFDAVRRTITFSPAGPERTTVHAERSDRGPLVRPRGWHLPEKRTSSSTAERPGALVDFGLFFFHNAKALRAARARSSTCRRWRAISEARLWNDVFNHAQDGARDPAWHDQAHVCIETLRRVRDGRDPLRAARALRRASTAGALGLHLLVHQARAGARSLPRIVRR